MAKLLVPTDPITIYPPIPEAVTKPDPGGRDLITRPWAIHQNVLTEALKGLQVQINTLITYYTYVIAEQHGAMQNVLAAPTVVGVSTIPGDTVTAEGMSIAIDFAGAWAANANVKQLSFEMDQTFTIALVNLGPGAINGGSFFARVILTFSLVGTITVYAVINTNTPAGVVATVTQRLTTGPLFDVSQDMRLQFTLTGGATGDVSIDPWAAIFRPLAP